jgi:hypothetical protein
LRQIVPNAARDHAVFILASELPGIASPSRLMAGTVVNWACDELAFQLVIDVLLTFLLVD